MPLEPYRKPLTDKQRRKQRQQDDAQAWATLRSLAQQALARSAREPDTWLEVYDFHRTPRKIKATAKGWQFFSEQYDDYTKRFYFDQGGNVYTSGANVPDPARNAIHAHSLREWASLPPFELLVRALKAF